MKAKSAIPKRTGIVQNTRKKILKQPVRRTVGAQTPVLRLKRILVTTDFSDESKKALPYAAVLAERFGARIALLHVLESPSRFVGMETMALLSSGDAAAGRAYGALDAMAKKAFKSEAAVTTHVQTGKPIHEIVKASRELGVDLVILATHGYSGLKHTFLGSTTERVVREMECAVLAVRGRQDEDVSRTQKPAALQRIVLATDFSANAAQALPAAETLARAFDSSLTLMHVVERVPIDSILGTELADEHVNALMVQARTRLADIAATLRKNKIAADVKVRFGNPFDEITRGAKEIDASLIVLATHGYTGLKRAYLGSVAERVLRHAHCPVLVVRGRKR